MAFYSSYDTSTRTLDIQLDDYVIFNAQSMSHTSLVSAVLGNPVSWRPTYIQVEIVADPKSNDSFDLRYIAGERKLVDEVKTLINKRKSSVFTGNITALVNLPHIVEDGEPI